MRMFEKLMTYPESCNGSDEWKEGNLFSSFKLLVMGPL